MKRSMLFILILFLAGPAFGDGGANCFSVLAGRQATADGAVLFAHNEDDPWPQIVNWHKVPRKRHEPDDVVTLKAGGTVPQVAETYAYVWLQMPGTDFSDTYMNEFGVTIASNACKSRVQTPDLTDGGIGWWLRRFMAERAKTAREAVVLAGQLVEQFGYTGSGRSYCVADGNEAWMMAVINGKQWVACRIPDDQVAVIANRYTIGEIDLADPSACIGSADVVTFAVANGWYDPETDGPFLFRDVYSNPESRFGIRNIARQWRGINRLKADPVKLKKPMPFTFAPRKKLTLKDLFDELRDHYEGTEFAGAPGWNNGNPHDYHIMRICSQRNMYGAVAHLRSDLPAEIGSVLWVAMRRPCVQPFVPVFAGISGFPAAFSRVAEPAALDVQFKDVPERFRRTGDLAWWSIVDRGDQIDGNYAAMGPEARATALKIENTLLTAVPGFQLKAAEAWTKKPLQVQETLTGLTALGLNQLLQLNR